MCFFAVLSVIALSSFLTGCQKDGLELISIQEYSGLKVATVKSPAIADNITGEKSTRMLTIYLPPGYESNDTSYPVVYYFPGLRQTPLHIKKIVPKLDSYFIVFPENCFYYCKCRY